MIVRQYKPGTAVKRGIGDNLPHWKLDAAFVALMPRQMDAAGLLVHVRNPETFKPWVAIGETAREKCPGSGKPIKLEREFGTLEPHSADLSSCDRRRDWNRLDLGSNIIHNGLSAGLST